MKLASNICARFLLETIDREMDDNSIDLQVFSPEIPQLCPPCSRNVPAYLPFVFLHGRDSFPGYTRIVGLHRCPSFSHCFLWFVCSFSRLMTPQICQRPLIIAIRTRRMLRAIFWEQNRRNAALSAELF
jgi:hypothetical protein